MQPLKNLSQQIDELMNQGQVFSARAAIQTYIPLVKNDPHERLRIAEWYRRMGRFHQALAILKPNAVLISKGQSPNLSSPEGMEFLTCARLFNLLGASNFATAVLDRLNQSPTNFESSQIMAMIYLSNYQYQKALPLLLKAQKYGAPNARQEALLQVSLADTFMGLDQTTQAIEIIQELRNHSLELVRFIADTANGEYLARLQRTQEALVLLQPWQDSQFTKNLTNDSALFHKWLGFSLYCEGNKKLGTMLLQSAFKHFYRGASKAEGWLEVLYFHGLAAYQANPSIFPKQWNSVLLYPDCRIPFKNLIHQHWGYPRFCVRQGKLKRVRPTFRPSSVKSYWHLSTRCRVSSKKFQLLKEQTHLLISLLIQASPYGISKFRLIELIWPEQIFSFFTLENRLKQLVLQVRARGYEVKSQKNVLHLKNFNSKREEILISTTPYPLGADFLEAHTVFKRQQVEAEFATGKTQAHRLIKEWKECNAVSDLYSTNKKAQYKSEIREKYKSNIKDQLIL